jgi:hypothetical protein
MVVESSHLGSDASFGSAYSALDLLGLSASPSLEGGDVPESDSGKTPAAWEWYEFICPVHGVIVRHRRSDPRPPDVPLTCPDDMLGLRIRCGEVLKFRFSTSSGPKKRG